MSPTALAALAGAVAGAGVLLVALGLAPAPRPDLTAALARLDAPAPPPDDATADPAGGLRGRVTGPVLARLRRLPVPAADLALLREDPDAFLLRKATLGLLAFLAPAAALAALGWAGLALPLVVPLAVGLGAGLVGFLAPDLAVRSRARTARAEFRRAAGAYLDLVALERAADGGPAEALHRAAEVAHGWVFVRIRDALDHARLAGRPPWEALSDLAAEVGVPDLADLADIVALAGDDGAAVYDTLLAKAAALRNRTRADAQAAANAASERMTLPAVLLGVAFLILVAYPALARVLT